MTSEVQTALEVVALVWIPAIPPLPTFLYLPSLDLGIFGGLGVCLDIYPALYTIFFSFRVIVSLFILFSNYLDRPFFWCTNNWLPGSLSSPTFYVFDGWPWGFGSVLAPSPYSIILHYSIIMPFSPILPIWVYLI